MASALANRARGAIVGSAVADAAGRKLVFTTLLSFKKTYFSSKHMYGSDSFGCPQKHHIKNIDSLSRYLSLKWMYSSQRSPSTGCMTSRNCGDFWMKIQTLSSDRNQRILSTEGRRASRAVMETRHLYCWSHCLSAEVDFLPYPSQMSFKERPSVDHFEAIKIFCFYCDTCSMHVTLPVAYRHINHETSTSTYKP